jgi:hypothetical protein
MMDPEPPPPSDDVVARREALAHVGKALDSGLVSPREVERFVARAGAERGAGVRPTAALVLFAVGGVVVFGGLALAYATVFSDLPRALRLTTPFLFPLAALAVCLILQRRHARRWQAELAGLVTYAALGGACATVGMTSGWLVTDHDVALYAGACAALATVLVIGLWTALRSLNLLVLGLGVTLATLGLSVAELAGLLSEGRLSWVLLAEALVAACVASLMRRDAPVCRSVSYWAMAGVWASSVAGISAAGGDHFSIWHVTLAAGIVIAFLVAAAMNFNGLLWLAALAGLQWLQAIAVVVGSATNAAFTVVLTGIGLLGLGFLVTRLSRHIRPAA